MNFAPLPEPLPETKLSVRATLPSKPAPVTLTGRIVRLVPLEMERDTEALYAVSNGSAIRMGERSVDAYDAEALIWRYLFAGPFATPAEFKGYLQGHLDAPDYMPLTVYDTSLDRQVGVACFMSNAPAHLKIELGSIWYSPIAQRTGANLEATYLMLRHAFGLGYRRVEWKCNALNERSRRAALRMGFRFEGIQEGHYIIKGRNRDTAWFRMLEAEWPAVRAQLEAMLYGAKEGAKE